MNDPNNAPSESCSERPLWDYPPGDPRHLREEEEAALLERVETQLLEEFRQTGSRTAKRSPWRGWLLVPIAGLAAVALFFVLRNPLAPLQHQGTFLTKPPTVASRAGSWKRYKTAPTRGGELSVQRQWKLRVAKQTSLRLTRPSEKSLHVKLKRGTIHVHVVPGAMKQVLVQSSAVQVWVKGTRFSVERHRKWVRVEVWRGLVEIRARGRRGFALPRGEGVQFHVATGRQTRYKLPPASHRAPPLRLRWLAQHNPGDLRRYMDSLKENVQFKRKGLSELYQRAADWAARTRRFGAAYRLRLEVADLGGEERESALLDAARYCARTTRSPRPCLRLYERYFLHWGRGNRTLFVSALWNLAAAKSLPLPARITLLKKAAATVPPRHRRSLLQTLARLWLKSGVSCTALGGKMSLPSRGDLWLQRRCPALFPRP